MDRLNNTLKILARLNRGIKMEASIIDGGKGVTVFMNNTNSQLSQKIKTGEFMPKANCSGTMLAKYSDRPDAIRKAFKDSQFNSVVDTFMSRFYRSGIYEDYKKTVESVARQFSAAGIIQLDPAFSNPYEYVSIYAYGSKSELNYISLGMDSPYVLNTTYFLKECGISEKELGAFLADAKGYWSMIYSGKNADKASGLAAKVKETKENFCDKVYHGWLKVAAKTMTEYWGFGIIDPLDSQVAQLVLHMTDPWALLFCHGQTCASSGGKLCYFSDFYYKLFFDKGMANKYSQPFPFRLLLAYEVDKSLFSTKYYCHYLKKAY